MMSAWAMFLRTGPFSLKYSVICLRRPGLPGALLDVRRQGVLPVAS